MRTTDTHVYFWNGIYSNWHPSRFTHNGLEFANSEQAFMWWKADTFGDHGIKKIVEVTTNPREVKKLGRQVKGYDEKIWESVRYEMMRRVVYDKFDQNPEMKKELLATGDKTIVEASPYDKVWGVGLLEDDNLILDEANWKGQNLLGKVLMDVRKEFRES